MTKLDDRTVRLAEAIYAQCLGAMCQRFGPNTLQGKVDHVAISAVTNAKVFYATVRKVEAAMAGKPPATAKAETVHAKTADELLQSMAAEAQADRVEEAENGARGQEAASREP